MGVLIGDGGCAGNSQIITMPLDPVFAVAPMAEVRAVTQLLSEWRAGDNEALDELTPLIYEELRRVARRFLHSERRDHTLQATGLVNEAFIRLAGTDVPWVDRAHFFAVAARMMRRILIDYAKARGRAKRGAGFNQTVFDEGQLGEEQVSVDILDVDDALDRLEKLDARKCDVVVLHFFGGLTYDEMAEALGISAATVDRHLRLGKAWLVNELKSA